MSEPCLNTDKLTEDSGALNADNVLDSTDALNQDSAVDIPCSTED